MQTIDRTWTRDAAETWARALYDNAVDRKDAAGFAAAFTDDAVLRFGNNDPLVGRASIETAIAGFFTASDDGVRDGGDVRHAARPALQHLRRSGAAVRAVTHR